jgi:hypothetical protein
VTGRRLYEVVCDEMFRAKAEQENRWQGDRNISSNGFAFVVTEEGGKELAIAPPAFAFLNANERKAWNAAAKRLSGRR